MFFANYLVFADEVSGNYMRELGFDWSDPESMPCFVFMANASCDYLHECHSGDDIDVEVAYTRIGNTSATLSFRMTRVSDGVAVAKGSFAQVFVDRQSRKPTAIPASVRNTLETAIG
jgi:acyl-CoA thioester hydrolase